MGPSAGGKSSAKQPTSGERSQSEVVGVILILGLVMAGSFAILALGATAIGDTEEKLSGDRAEKTLTQLDSKAGLVALGEADSQKVSLPERGNEDFSVNESKGTLTIEVTNATNGNTISWGNPLIEVDLGVMEFENGDTKMAYQGGGVFRADARNGTMVSPPEFHYRNGTLTLPIVNITGNRDLGPTATVTHSDENRTFPLQGSSNRTNPLDNHKVQLTVQSEYYEGWGQYFEERTDGEVTYDHDAETVTLILKTPIGEQEIQNAIGATSSDGDFKIAGNDDRTDSYNSSYDEYAVSQTYEGNISAAGDFEVAGGSTVDGGVRVGGELKCKGNSEINGTGYYAGTTPDIKGSCDVVDGTESIDSVEGVPAINSFVNNTVDELEDDNDNGGTPAEDDELKFTGGTAQLVPGEYYLEELVVGTNDVLELDTQGDTITIAVRDYVELEENSKIFVQGDGKVEILVYGNDTVGTEHVTLGDGSTIETEGATEYAPRFWIYGNDNMKAQIGDPGGAASYMEGVIFAPADASGNSRVNIYDAEMFGGVVAGTVELHNGQKSTVHFDKALEDEQAVPEDTKVTKITYLHITENEIEIG